MEKPDIAATVNAGRKRAKSALGLRESLRWRSSPGAHDREAAITAMLDGIDDVMKRIRSIRGYITWHTVPAAEVASIEKVSAALQYERKQLKKMRR